MQAGWIVMPFLLVVFAASAWTFEKVCAQALNRAQQSSFESNASAITGGSPIQGISTDEAESNTRFSMRAVRAWRHGGRKSAPKFDFHAHLSFACETRGKVIFQSGNETLYLEAPPKMRSRLSSVDPGTAFRLTGVCDGEETRSVRLTLAENLDSASAAKPLSLKSPFALPANLSSTGLVEINAVPQEALISGTVVSIESYRYSRTVQIDDGTGVIAARIPIDESNPTNGLSRIEQLRNGSVVSISGCPLCDREPSAINNGAGDAYHQTRLMVADAKDLIVQSLPWLYSPKEIFVFIAPIIAILVSVFGLAWILCRQVAARTEKLLSTTSHLRAAFESMQEALIISDSSGNTVRVNRQLNELLGVQGGPFDKADDYFELISSMFDWPRELQAFLSICSCEPLRSHSVEVVNKSDGSSLHITSNPVTDSSGTASGRIWIVRDSTEKRRLTSELVQSQKMEAIGLLAGGIAHDFNNFLSVIRGSLTMLQKTENSTNTADKELLDSDAFNQSGAAGQRLESREDYLQVAHQTVDRASKMTRQLLGFARKSRMEFETVDANEIVAAVEGLVHGSFSKQTSLKVTKSDDKAWVRADVIYLEQAILNLCLNAKDAYADQSGIVEVSVTLTKQDLLGDAVRIRVQDQGMGMSESTKKQIFEPFFTTKDAGHGTGLGLSTALGVIEQHNGILVCESTLGEGTMFDILLPLSTDPPFVETFEGSLAGQSPGSLSILLVDDEPMVRETSAAMLVDLSHRVTLASNGMQAIKQIAENGTYDLVMLDLAMPDMSGFETLTEIQSAWPDQKIIVCSGYSDDFGELDSIPEDKRPAFLMKPYKAAELEETLRYFRDGHDSRIRSWMNRNRPEQDHPVSN